MKKNLLIFAVMMAMECGYALEQCKQNHKSWKQQRKK